MLPEQIILKMGVEAYHKGNYAQALKLLRPLAVQGNAIAQLRLGLMYAEGEGVTQNYIRAHMWSNLAASKGNKIAKKNRDFISKEMTPAQIAEAQKMALDCEKSSYKNCE